MIIWAPLFVGLNAILVLTSPPMPDAVEITVGSWLAAPIPGGAEGITALLVDHENRSDENGTAILQYVYEFRMTPRLTLMLFRSPRYDMIPRACARGMTWARVTALAFAAAVTADHLSFCFPKLLLIFRAGLHQQRHRRQHAAGFGHQRWPSGRRNQPAAAKLITFVHEFRRALWLHRRQRHRPYETGYGMPGGNQEPPSLLSALCSLGVQLSTRSAGVGANAGVGLSHRWVLISRRP